jgi:Family of unknown function (DUF5317)
VFLLVGAAVGLLAGLATGGSLRPLVALRIGWPMLLVVLVALAIKELGVFGPLARSDLTPWLFVTSNLALVLWAIWHRRRLRGVELVGLGIALNLVVVASNSGHMPVAPALAHQGPPELLRYGVWGQYVLAGPGTRLNWLGDGIRLPAPIDRVFPQAFSPGDLVSWVGLAVVLFLLTRPRGPAERGTITIP